MPNGSGLRKEVTSSLAPAPGNGHMLGKAAPSGRRMQAMTDAPSSSAAPAPGKATMAPITKVRHSVPGFISPFRHHSLLSIVPFTLAALYVLLCPFNKVEESFHTQAVHDLLVHGPNIDKYDHHLFPGVVPRTFIGALILAVLSLPLKAAVYLLGLPKIFLQVGVRMVLAALVCLSYGRLMDSVSRRLGGRTARAMAYVVAVTPHFLFYASRTLPNTFGLLFVLNGFAEWLRMPVQHDGHHHSQKHLRLSIFWFVAAILWFRCDVLVLLGPVALSWLVTRKATFPQLIVNGAVIGTLCLAATVLIDSWFWQRWLWPEGVVLFFNTVQNRSHEYGVSPWHWYFTSAIPRALLGMLFFVPFGLVTMVPSKRSIGNASSVQPAAAAAAAAASSSSSAASQLDVTSPPPSLRAQEEQRIEEEEEEEDSEGLSDDAAPIADPCDCAEIIRPPSRAGGSSTGNGTVGDEDTVAGRLRRRRRGGAEKEAGAGGGPSGGSPRDANNSSSSSSMRINYRPTTSTSTGVLAPLAVCPPTCPPPPVYSSIDEFFWSRHAKLTSIPDLLRKVRVDWDVLELVLPAVGFVALYSLLPHKELRFLLPGFPLLHIAAARGASKVFRIGEALFHGMVRVTPGPEAAAAEVLADLAETTFSKVAPPVVADTLSTPRAVLETRHRRYDEEKQLRALAVGEHVAGQGAAGRQINKQATKSLGRKPVGGGGDDSKRPAIPAFARIKQEMMAAGEVSGKSANGNGKGNGKGSAAAPQKATKKTATPKSGRRSPATANGAPLPAEAIARPASAPPGGGALSDDDVNRQLAGAAAGTGLANPAPPGQAQTFTFSDIGDEDDDENDGGYDDDDEYDDDDDSEEVAGYEATGQRISREWQQAHAGGKGHVSPLRRTLGLVALASVAALLLFSAGATFLFVRVSMHNYPGGEALQRLYSLYAGDIHGRLLARAQQRGLESSPSVGGGKKAVAPVVSWWSWSAPASLPLISSLPPLHLDSVPASGSPAKGSSSSGSAGSAGLSQHVPPCPMGDVTAQRGPLEWWRQCIDAKAGCPTAVPWIPALQLPSLTSLLTLPRRVVIRAFEAVTFGWWPVSAHASGAVKPNDAFLGLGEPSSLFCAFPNGSPAFPEAELAFSGASSANASRSLVAAASLLTHRFAYRPMRVHIDVAAAETGVSRFGEAWSDGWSYDKSEDLSPSRPLDFESFDYLLTEKAAPFTDLFEVLETIHSFVRVDWRSLSIVKKPSLFILRRKREDLMVRRRLNQERLAREKKETEGGQAAAAGSK